MDLKSFNITVRGASHIKKDKECQDYSLHYSDENCTLAIVADGHGGDDYIRSAIGSKIACEVMAEKFKEFFTLQSAEQMEKDSETHINTLKKSIISGWNKKIHEYHDANPFKERELQSISSKARKRYIDDAIIEPAYGTTLIGIGITKEYWIGFHIGDGKCVAINESGEFKQPIKWDEKCFLNATTSICDEDALDRVRHIYSKKMPAAIFVGSDGVDDSFKGAEQLYNFYKTILYSFSSSEESEALHGLEDYLPRLSAQGSGDDVSIAAIFNLDAVKELNIIKEFDRAKERARKEENIQKEIEKDKAIRREADLRYEKLQEQKEAAKKRAEMAALSKKSAKDHSDSMGEQGATIRCRYCRTALKSTDKFCSECGEVVEGVAPERSRFEDKNEYHERVRQEREKVAERERSTGVADPADLGPVATPQVTPEAAPQGAPEATPQGAPEATPQGTLEATPQGEPEATPQGTPEAIPQGTSEVIPQGAPEATPQGTLEGTPQGIPEATPQGTPEETPQGTPEETPQGTPEETPQGTPEGTPQGTSEAAPQETPQGTPEGTPQGALEATPQETPEATLQGTIETTPQGTPEGTPQGIPEATSEGVKEPASENATESIPGATPEGVKESASENATESLPKATSDVVEEPVSQSVTEPVPEATLKVEEKPTSPVMTERLSQVTVEVLAQNVSLVLKDDMLQVTTKPADQEVNASAMIEITHGNPQDSHSDVALLEADDETIADSHGSDIDDDRSTNSSHILEGSYEKRPLESTETKESPSLLEKGKKILNDLF